MQRTRESREKEKRKEGHFFGGEENVKRVEEDEFGSSFCFLCGPFPFFSAGCFPRFFRCSLHLVFLFFVPPERATFLCCFRLSVAAVCVPLWLPSLDNFLWCTVGER